MLYLRSFLMYIRFFLNAYNGKSRGTSPDHSFSTKFSHRITYLELNDALKLALVLIFFISKMFSHRVMARCTHHESDPVLTCLWIRLPDVFLRDQNTPTPN